MPKCEFSEHFSSRVLYFLHIMYQKDGSFPLVYDIHHNLFFIYIKLLLGSTEKSLLAKTIFVGSVRIIKRSFTRILLKNICCEYLVEFLFSE